MVLSHFKNWILVLFILSNFACEKLIEGNTEGVKKEDVLLAQTKNQSLYLSELDGMIPANTTQSDSVVIINAYVERWIRNNLLMQEAERNIPKDLNIDELVRNYRASLVQHSYEKQLVEQELDSVITPEELNHFYERNKEQYQLEAPIIRCNFIKVSQDAPDLKELQQLWQSDSLSDSKKLLRYCSQYAEVYLLADSVWYNVDDIIEELPIGTIDSKNIGSRKEISLRDNEFLYLFRLFEIINRKEIAPLSFIEDQASKVILHRRKIKLLEEKKEELYEAEIKKNNVKVYSFQKE